MDRGFRLVSEEIISDIKSKGYIYAHDSGAKLVHIKNRDENLVFSITVKTPVKNNTGVAHILEHCILAGSKKYPLKDPFNQLIKTKLYSYLNAITFKDKTLYAVASYNEKELFSMADVYLDAVFNPLIFERKEVFLQEGWNLDGGSESLCSGIVYNEMKPVYTDTLYLLKRMSYSALFPNTQYKYDAAGCPDSITKLNYSDFLNYYKQTYHPENTCLYLYGDINISKYLNYINSEYLKLYRHSIKKTVKIDLQNPLKEPIFIHRTSSLQIQRHLCAAFVINTFDDVNIINILGYYLLGLPNSPLKKDLLKISESIEFEFETDMAQPTFFIFVQNSSVDSNEFRDILMNSIQKILARGIDESFIEACISRYEFKLRKEDYGYKPRGLAYNIEILSSFMYSEVSFESLNRLEEINAARKDKDIFKNVLQKYFLLNTHVAYIKLENSVFNKKYSSVLKVGDLKQIKTDLYNLKKFHQSTQDKSISEKIKSVEMSDISLYPKKYIADDEYIDGFRFVHAQEDLNGSLVLSLNFDIRFVPNHLLRYIGMYIVLIGKLGTKNCTQKDFDKKILQNIGELSTSLRSCVNYKNKSIGNFFELKVELLGTNLQSIREIFVEILLNTDFDNVDIIESLILEHKLKIEKDYYNRGHEIAKSKIKSLLSKDGAKREEITGMNFYNYLSDICDNFSEKASSIICGLKEVRNYLFTKESFMVLAISDATLKVKIKSISQHLYKCLPNSINKESSFVKLYFNSYTNFDAKTENNCNAMGFNMFLGGFKYSGKILVLEMILNTDYLQNEVRIKGGAYGSSAEIDRGGNIVFYSYRDPNIAKTYDVFRNSSKFLKNMHISEKELRRYIVAAINLQDRPMHPYKFGEKILNNLLCGITYDDLLKEREEMLQTNLADIKVLAECMESCDQLIHYVTIGNEVSSP